jgi:DNA polymerase (family X)
MSAVQPSNAEIADLLVRIADLLEVQEANPHRLRAYRNAARTVRQKEQALAGLVEQGDGEALQNLPDIGAGLSMLIVEFIDSGRSSLLERLQAEVTPVKLLMQVPGIGEILAQRIIDRLNISTLEALEQAAHDGRLRQVEGMGKERVRAVRMSLAVMLSGAAQRRRRLGGPDGEPPPPPPVALMLDVDQEYRRRAAADELQQIAPKRFNPTGEAWLPIMRTERGAWAFTALYSNTARAHDLGKTHDWVVLYYTQNDTEDQATVVTESHGSLKNKRVVRGRESECRDYYQSQ